MADIDEVIKRIKQLPAKYAVVCKTDRDAILDELAHLRDVISRAIYRLDPNAPNDEPYILTGAITLKEVELERLRQENAELRKDNRTLTDRIQWAHDHAKDGDA